MYIFRYSLFISSCLVLTLVKASPLNVIEHNENEQIVNITNINEPSKVTLRITPVRKRQMSRVSEKRYEIVNMLWRKTKIFADVESFTRNTNKIVASKMKREHKLPDLQSPEKLIFSLPYLRKSSSTPSYIEFHYLDVGDDKQQTSLNKNSSPPKHKDQPRSVINSPFFVFHLQYETCKSTKTSSITPTQPLENKDMFPNVFLAYLTTIVPKKQSTKGDDTTENLDLETCPLTTLPPITINSTSTIHTTPYNYNDQDEQRIDTTIYDKIKFFEMYDNNTPLPNKENNLVKIENKTEPTKSIDPTTKTVIDDFDITIKIQPKYNKTRFVKKHIDKSMSDDYFNDFYTQPKSTTSDTTEVLTKAIDDTEDAYLSRPAAWSDFPFVGIYLYDPFQVRCDAAALSPHWLLAAASCLSKRYKDIYYTETQSAYVAYCTDNWRNPERISYVKRTHIHPRFDASDITNRHLFNIGVIEVVNSMAETCNGWAPISLISHQFDASAYGSTGVAVGWGLDRYDVSHPSSVNTLMRYENLVYSDFCGPKTATSKLTNFKTKLNDVYCLSLPNYSDGNNNPVHGAMLLIGGKLIAMYLQDQRLPSGDQSALYSGVWRHIPWILDTAREPEEFVTFSLHF